MVLNAEFAKSPNWSSEFITSLAQQFGVDRRRVYKWNYDRKMRLERERSELESVDDMIERLNK